MQVNIHIKKNHGLEVFECRVNGTLAAHFMSIEMARSWAKRFLQRNSI